MFHHLKIATRLQLTLGLLAVIILSLSVLGTWSAWRLAEDADYYRLNLVPSYQEQNRAAIALGIVRGSELRHILSSSESEMRDIEAGIEGSARIVEAAFARYAKELLSDDEDRRLMDKAKEAFDAYRAQRLKVLQMSRLSAQDPSKDADATALATGPSAQAYEAAQAAISAWWDYNVKLSDLQAKGSVETYASTRALLLGSAALAIALTIVAGIWLVRGIARPLAMAVATADRVAAADMTQAIQADGEDEAALLMKALSRMQQNIARIVVDVRASSEGMAKATAEIAQGGQDLGQRTELQASALQQTAATMDQLNTTVRNNAEHARQASQLALRASEVASKGGEVVGRVVSTMQGISDSSRRIGDIIGVIDGIAFQTNILALNAAVEAARAGEQGRGFAVVASEVRSLAQRSAEAAREIKSLIGHSAEQVEQGTVLVDEAGKTMGEIVGSIKRVSDIVAEISSASQEQSAGIAQVGDAVAQLDQATQQNAALVEESAAASESLRGQAQQLVQAVAVFKLSGEPA